MRIAVIDCGTNTFNLLIADIYKTGFKPVYRRKRVVKLGSQGITEGIIGPEPFAKGIHALSEFKILVEEHEVKKVIIVGTAALRDAKNGRAFLKAVNAATGFRIKLIDGDTEAKLICYGLREAIDLDKRVTLAMDIGGGSVEFIICNQYKIFWKRSYRIGAARILEIFNPSDPIRASELKNIENYLEKELSSLFPAVNKYKPVQFAGTSGSFETFASMLLHKKGTPNFLRGKTKYTFDPVEYRRLHKELLKSTLKERLQMPGMLRMRADMIVVASILLNFILKKSGIKEMHLSMYALKEGIISKLLNK